MNTSNKTNKIAIVGVLSALYFVLSLTLKIPTGFGAIALDMGYIVLTVSAITLGPIPAALVGGIGAAVESSLLSPYGISIGWVVMNIIIGLICGYALHNADNIKMVRTIIIIVIAVFIGVCAKTGIECTLYSIPLIVKAPKSIVAWIIDSIVMVIGIPIAKRVKDRIV